ncbi:MAG: HDOD domain-containing protein [Proteobacteria bacterium]|jgi:HD-like signal output (HDOD) protein|nr:HDOD domain-containing protein [Pseudomonadota bacterium]
MSAEHQGNIAGPSNQAAFAFVQSLALEMSAGKIEIPSFPDVAVRVRKVLADENCSAAQIARVVSAEPAMAAKLLQMANSAALNPNGNKITELKSAIARIGLSNVRSASLAYAMDQIKNAKELAPLRKPLHDLWERSVRVAAMSYVVARSWSKVNADQAMLAGLMHGMGRVYILTRAVKHPGLFNDPTTYHQIVRDWNAQVAKAVLESWEISPDIIDAVENYEVLDRAGTGEVDLTDVLTIANVLVSFHTDLPALEMRLKETSAAVRLGVNAEAVQKVLQETVGEIASLRSALGG